MAGVRDLYEILGVPRDATQDEIKRAYRRLARELHPDVSNDPSTEERFKEVTAAYEILSDPDKRRQYDRYGQGGADVFPFGEHREVEVELLETCDRCSGLGAEPGTGPTRCRTCGGTGQIQDVRRSIF